MKTKNYNIALILQNWSFPALIFLFYFLEAYQKLLGEDNIITAIKALIFTFFTISVAKKENIRFFIPIIFLASIFIIAQFYTKDSYTYKSILMAFKFFFPLLVLKSLDSCTLNKRILFNSIEWLLVFNSILIFIALAFEISIFKTYSGFRFGYNGLFYASATGSYIYSIGLFYFVLLYGNRVYKHWKFLLVLVSCIFLGTKIMYLSIGTTLVALLLMNRKKFSNYVLAFGILLITSGFLIYILNFSIFSTIYKDQGFLSAALSYRNELFLNTTLPHIKENWSSINYLIGGVSNFDLRAQMEIVDVFFFWGLIGGCLYLWLFYKLITPKNLNILSTSIIVILSVAFAFAGNFFTYTYIPLFLIVLKLSIEENLFNIQD